MSVEQPSVGIFLINILQNFGLVFDDDTSTPDRLVLSNTNDGFNLVPCVEILKINGNRKAFMCDGELVFNYDNTHIYLPNPISSHDLMCKILQLCGWTITYVTNDKLEYHDVKVSSALSPTTYNVVLILSDHIDGKISETRISYLNKVLLGITIKDTRIVIYTEHKDVSAAMYEIVVDK